MPRLQVPLHIDHDARLASCSPRSISTSSKSSCPTAQTIDRKSDDSFVGVIQTLFTAAEKSSTHFQSAFARGLRAPLLRGLMTPTRLTRARLELCFDFRHCDWLSRWNRIRICLSSVSHEHCRIFEGEQTLTAFGIMAGDSLQGSRNRIPLRSLRLGYMDVRLDLFEVSRSSRLSSDLL